MPFYWKIISVVVPISNGKGDVMNCRAYRGEKLLEHTMKIVDMVLERRIRAMVSLDKMQLGFMPRKGTTDALLRMQEEYPYKRRSSTCVKLWI